MKFRSRRFYKYITLKNVENNGVLKSEGEYLVRNTSIEEDGELIYNGGVPSDQSKIKNIVNNGIMIMTLNKDQKRVSWANIIENGKGKEIDTITNNGRLITNIIADGPTYNSIATTGIYSNGDIKEIENNGIIEGFVYILGNSNYMGIELYSDSKLDKLRNNGIIYADSNEKERYKSIVFGVYVDRGKVIDFINKGIILGQRQAVIGHGKNYGLLVQEFETDPSDMAIEGLGVKINAESNYTILKTGNSNNVTFDIDGTNFTVKNASEKKDGDKIVGTNSIDVNGKVTNTIYNGITDTVKVTGENATLDNVTVNAYTNAIVFGESGGNLTLNNSTVNGGIDRKYSDTGVLLSSSAIIKGGKGADTLTVMGDIKLNGKIDLSEGEDTINFGEKVQAEKSYAANASTENTSTMTIFDDISGVENININEDVILFETAKVTGAKNIEIGEGKELGLKLKNGAYLEDFHI